ncbi:hypothetical protein ACIOJE_10240 [Kitasatospora sp. NPDC087861]
MQLQLNLAGIVLAGVLTLLVQKGAWALIRRRRRPGRGEQMAANG